MPDVTRAPVALFVYNRPHHARRLLESLAANPEARESRLVVFADGPATDADADAVRAARAVVREREWCGGVELVESETNRGLAASIIGGVTRLVEEAGRVIVLEDDLVLSPFFLGYMNRALARYENEPRVMQVAGYMFPLALRRDDDAVFLRHTTSWGWGTWRHAWREFDPEVPDAAELETDPALAHRFNFGGAFPYATLLRDWRAGRIDSWSIRWHWAVFRREGLGLFPVRSLVRNAGFDGSGRHCGATRVYETALADRPVCRLPVRIEPDPDAEAAVRAYYRRITRERRPPPWARARRRLGAWLRGGAR
jgi:hypothetical protein